MAMLPSRWYSYHKAVSPLRWYYTVSHRHQPRRGCRGHIPNILDGEDVKSTRTPLRELTIKENLKFSTSEFTKICHFEITTPKICPLSSPLLGGEGNTPSHTPPPPAVRRPNFELALMPLPCPIQR